MAHSDNGQSVSVRVWLLVVAVAAVSGCGGGNTATHVARPPTPAPTISPILLGTNDPCDQPRLQLSMNMDALGTVEQSWATDHGDAERYRGADQRKYAAAAAAVKADVRQWNTLTTAMKSMLAKHPRCFDADMRNSMQQLLALPLGDQP